ncbi:MAG: hypothetical protein K8H87_14485 [Pseudorhodoplanes sp.]|nr:hypothetical protein [Pseudorhodoplanes sp.]
MCYPKVGREYGYGHHNIPWTIAGRRPIGTEEDVAEKFLVEVNDTLASHDVVVSSEEFSANLMSTEKFATDLDLFLNKLRGRIKIILYLRQQKNAAFPTWMNLVRHGFSASFYDWVNSPEDAFSHLDYCSLMERTLSCRHEDVVVVLYESEDRSSFLDRFVSHLNWSSAPPVSPWPNRTQLKSNASYSPGIAELLRQLNSLNRSSSQTRDPIRLRLSFEKFLRSEEGGAINWELNRLVGRNPSGDLEAMLDERFEQANKRLMLELGEKIRGGYAWNADHLSAKKNSALAIAHELPELVSEMVEATAVYGKVLEIMRVEE